MKLKHTHPLYEAVEGEDGEVMATEERDGEAWLNVEFPSYGTVIAPADQFE